METRIFGTQKIALVILKETVPKSQELKTNNHM